jgi:hypothetical protein
VRKKTPKARAGERHRLAREGAYSIVRVSLSGLRGSDDVSAFVLTALREEFLEQLRRFGGHDAAVNFDSMVQAAVATDVID